MVIWDGARDGRDVLLRVLSLALRCLREVVIQRTVELVG
jgi:hypothetical protein